ncbi:hypothetical protein ACFY8B_21770 [Streptomyces sp. NPDC012751]|uniref:hypothetical protein n=1 Tax=Streptomyces sp. NPDC012751 TaxID=3364846 RepID=UPI0036CFC066
MSLSIPRHDFEKRREMAARLAGGSCESLQTALTEDEVAGNIENFVGAVSVPVGLVGPIDIHGPDAEGTFVVPMATLEGTLVASYSRGAKLMNLSGGCEVEVYGDQFLRAVQFTTASLADARKLVAWCREREETLRDIAVGSSGHLRLVEITYDRQATRVLLSMACTTGDAMGSNMVSKAISKVSEFVTAHSGLVQYDVLPYPEDKKSLPLRRKGKQVLARTVLRREVVRSMARTSLERLERLIEDFKGTLAQHGAYSLNLHMANGMTGLFQAFGQDLAYVAECTQAVLETRWLGPDELEVCLTMPTLIVATVGGGTGLPPYQTTLAMVDCVGDGKARKLAAIIAAVLLAGEINCAAAMCAHEFVAAHEGLGRNRPEDAPVPGPEAVTSPDVAVPDHRAQLV